ncbi:MAG: hypothetical protein ACREGI_04035 [Candidatus Levyibacteriota bacterium]
MKSKKVFLAPDALVAFINRADAKHLHASAFFRYFAQEQYFLYASVTAVGDAYREIAINISPVLAKEFIKAISLSSINILTPEESDVKLTYKTLLGSAGSDLTFQEALMAVMADRREIPYICTVGYLHSLFGLTTFYLPI